MTGKFYGNGFVSPYVFSVLQKLRMLLGSYVELDFLGKIMYGKKMIKMA